MTLCMIAYAARCAARDVWSRGPPWTSEHFSCSAAVVQCSSTDCSVHNYNRELVPLTLAMPVTTHCTARMLRCRTVATGGARLRPRHVRAADGDRTPAPASSAAAPGAAEAAPPPRRRTGKAVSKLASAVPLPVEDELSGLPSSLPLDWDASAEWNAEEAALASRGCVGLSPRGLSAAALRRPAHALRLLSTARRWTSR